MRGFYPFKYVRYRHNQLAIYWMATVCYNLYPMNVHRTTVRLDQMDKFTKFRYIQTRGGNFFWWQGLFRRCLTPNPSFEFTTMRLD